MSLRPKLASLDEDIAQFNAGKLESSTRVARKAADEPFEQTDALESDALHEDVGEAVDTGKIKGRRVRFALPEDDDGEDGEGVEKAAGVGMAIPGILNDIVEVPNATCGHAGFSGLAQEGGFPKPFKAHGEVESASGGKKKRGVSLFKRKMQEMRGSSDGAQEGMEPAMEKKSSTVGQLNFSMGGEYDDYSRENDSRIAGMSHSEILQAQKEIKEMIDPTILERFLAKFSSPQNALPSTAVSKEPNSSVPEQSPTAEEERESLNENVQDLSWIRTEEDLARAVQTLPDIEKEKLRWTGMVDGPEPPNTSSSPDAVADDSRDGVTSMLRSAGYKPSFENARFDLDGNFIDPEHALDHPEEYSSALFHHGGDQESPGYTMKELIRLARSSVGAQSSLALSCIAKVLKNRQTSLYEKPAKHQLFSLPRQLAMTIRLSLDSTSSRVILSALDAMEAYLVTSRFLTEVQYGWTDLCNITPLLPSNVPRAQGSATLFGRALDDEPLPSPSAQGTPLETEVEDFDRLQASPVLGMLHVGLVKRLSFLLGAIPGMQCGVPIGDEGRSLCFRILTYVVLHSDEAAGEVFENKDIVQFTMKYVKEAASKEIEGPKVMALLSDAFFFLQSLSLSRLEFSSSLTSMSNGDLVQASIQLVPRVKAAISFLRSLIESGVDTHQVLHRSQSVWEEFVKRFLDGEIDSSATRLLVFGIVNDDVLHRIAGKMVTSANEDITASDLNLLAHVAGREFPSGTREEEGLKLETSLTLFSSQKDTISASNTWTDTESFVLGFVDRAQGCLEEDLKRVPSKGTHSSRIPSVDCLDRILASIMVLLQVSSRERLRVEVRRRIISAGLIQRLAEDILESKLISQASTGKNGIQYSPRLLAWSQVCTKLRLTVTQLLVVVFGATSLQSGVDELQRLKILSLTLPRAPQRTRENASTQLLVRSMLRLWAKGARLESVFQQGLGLCLKERASSLRINSIELGEDFGSKKRRSMLQTKWEKIRTAWPLFVIFMNPNSEDSEIVASALDFCTYLVRNGCTRPEDVVASLALLFQECEEGSLFESHIVSKLNILLEHALAGLLPMDSVSSSEEPAWFGKVQRAAGGKSELLSTWQGLVVAFNERLLGHETAAALILLMLRMDAAKQVRLSLWTDLHGGNLLRLVAPPGDSSIPSLSEAIRSFTTPTETDPEIVRCFAHALSRKTIVKKVNPFLYAVITRQLAAYFWGADSTWNRRRFLKQLVLDSSYWDIACITADGEEYRNEQGEPSIHPMALSSLVALAREEPAVWKYLYDEGRIKLTDN